MRSAQLARRVARLERAFGRRAEEDQDQVFAQLDQLSPEQRRERIQYLATKIVKDRGIELLPGERVEDAAVLAIKASRARGEALLKNAAACLRERISIQASGRKIRHLNMAGGVVESDSRIGTVDQFPRRALVDKQRSAIVGYVPEV